eukprot:CAMPEP_0194364868 /NCGR_PEP_ID=MMETSP0174-20130528/12820_1 /TAXON_ID=216777 /ORGANISM="Proboscia alata, Strain PI-D3" /LENGTH=318 /DNA_ID=CAMNT_0039139169 /DNA_START=1 /DNA_END=959 /DNA_ORIENTATION=-
MLNPVAKTIRVVVVGAGSIGREFALHHFGPHTSTCVSAIVDTDLTAASLLARDVGALQAGAEVPCRYRSTVTASNFADAERIPHDALLTGAILADCDTVYIGTTPSSHRELVVRALTARRHVLLEKPPRPPTPTRSSPPEERRASRSQHWHAMEPRHVAPAQKPDRYNTTSTSSGDNTVVHASLTLRLHRWPQVWQRGAAWCAQRVDGGPLMECGTHYLAAVREVFGAVARVRATVVYPDGAAGGRGTGAPEWFDLRLAVNVEEDEDDNDGTAGSTAAAAGADCYELELETKSGTVWQMYDFVKLRQQKRALENDNVQ